MRGMVQNIIEALSTVLKERIANWHPADGVFDSNNFLARAGHLKFFAVVDGL